MHTAIDLERLAVRFRLNDNPAHCSTFEAVAAIGGDIAIFYGMLLMIPRTHRKRQWEMRHRLADLLDKRAKDMA